jgi:DNA-binding CsgD family transcriptional regulator
VLERLLQLVDELPTAGGAIALLRGGTGIGKTSVAEALVHASSDRARVLWGRCDDLSTPRPLGPLWDVSADAPGIRAALSADDPGLATTRLLELLSRAGRPTVMVVEDVHWADEATLDLLLSVGRRIGDTRALLVLTFRERLATDHPLGVVVGDLPHDRVHSIELQPLSREAVRTMAGDGQRGDRIWRLSGGNPFYVAALLRGPDDTVPSSVSDALRARVSRLTAPCRQLVLVLSIAPGGLELDVLERLDPALLAAVIEAEDERLLQLRGDVLVFRHELARTAIEGSLDEPTRRRLNLEVLQACEALDVDAARRAHHARGAHDVPSMLRLLPVAARQAARSGSHREARAHLEALQPLFDQLPPEQQIDLYGLWSEEEWFVTGGGLEPALAAVAVCRCVGDPTRLGRSLVAASRAAWASGDQAEAQRLADEALGVLERVGGEPLADAYANLSTLAMLDHRLADGVESAEAALRIATGPSRARATGLITLGVARAHGGEYREGLALLRDAEVMSERLGLARHRQRARGSMIDAVLKWDELGAARRLNDTFLGELDPEAAHSAWHRAIDARLDIAAGRYGSAEATLLTLREGRIGESVALWVAEFLAMALTRRGDPEAASVLADAWERAQRFGMREGILQISTRWAEYLWTFQRRDEEVTHRNLGLLSAPDALVLHKDAADLAMWLWLDGHLDRAPDSAAAPVRMLIGGNWGSAARWFADRGHPYEQAVALTTGDERARLRALRIAHELGARPLAARLRAELVASGVRDVPRGPRPTTRENPFGLTSRQLEVLRLLGEGRTNAEIGDRLFISARTAEKHVAAVRSKIGASDRDEAVRLSRDAGLLPGEEPPSDRGRLGSGQDG